MGGSQAGGGGVPPTAAATVRPGSLAGRTACHTGTQVQTPLPVPAMRRSTLDTSLLPGSHPIPGYWPHLFPRGILDSHVCADSRSCRFLCRASSLTGRVASRVPRGRNVFYPCPNTASAHIVAEH